MKLLMGLLSVLIIALFILPVQGQEHAAHHPEQGKAMKSDSSTGTGMMQGEMTGKQDMCGGMMKGGKMMEGKGKMIMHPFYHTIHHLADKKDKLNLSDKQVDQLKNIAADFMKRDADWKAAIEKKQIDLKLLFDKNASAAEVKKILQSISEIKLDGKAAAYETAQRMLSALSKEQKEKWQSASSTCISGKGMM